MKQGSVFKKDLKQTMGWLKFTYNKHFQTTLLPYSNSNNIAFELVFQSFQN